MSDAQAAVGSVSLCLRSPTCAFCAYVAKVTGLTAEAFKAVTLKAFFEATMSEKKISPRFRAVAIAVLSAFGALLFGLDIGQQKRNFKMILILMIYSVKEKPKRRFNILKQQYES